MHLCYVDDSGDSKNGTTLTALIVEDRHWRGLLSTWLEGRRELHAEFGVAKNTELHTFKLLKNRGKFCETDEQNVAFNKHSRAAAYRMLLTKLARFEHFTIITVAMQTTRKPQIYARFLAHLEDWAEAQDTHIMVFYDGQQGLALDGHELSQTEQNDLWETAVRDAAPYRRAHRDLDLMSRRIIEDVFMQDSRYSQLIQAVDLIAYGAYHTHLDGHPEIWGPKNTPLKAAVAGYVRLSDHWSEGSDRGVEWLEPDEDPESLPSA